MAKIKLDLSEVKSYQVEPGRYRARVIKIVSELSKQHKPMFTWHWRLLTGPEKGNEVRSWTSREENALFNLKNHLEALGHFGKVNLDTKNLLGKKAILVIGITTSSAEGGDERQFSNVMKVLPDEKENLRVPASERDAYDDEILYEDEDDDRGDDEEEEEDEDDWEDEDEEEEDDGEDDDWDDEEDDEDWEEEDEEPEPEPKPKKKKKGAKKSKKKRRLGDSEPPF